MFPPPRAASTSHIAALGVPPSLLSPDPAAGDYVAAHARPAAPEAAYAVQDARGGAPLHVVMIAPEVAPAAKVGGLGDVVVGLGRALQRRGHRVEVVCPRYGGLRAELVENERVAWGELWTPHGAEWRRESVVQGRVGGLDTFFVTGTGYTDRPEIYGYGDDVRRFAYFCRAALEYLYKSGRRPDIIHIHDWATALVPVMLFDIYAALGWKNSRVVFTIHNVECQGVVDDPDELFSFVGLDAARYRRPDRLQDDHNPRALNLMRGAVVYSNFVTTVSPTYAGEIKTASGGRGLEKILAAHAKKVGGILNGIDYEAWDPAADPAVPFPYAAAPARFMEKYKNKYALRDRLGLRDAWRPIVAVVSRLTAQKGLDLIRHAVFRTLEKEGQFVLLGSAPDPAVQRAFEELRDGLADNPDVRMNLGYDEDLAHLIYAGSDLFLVPSLYEPCGLTQMIAMRYGAVPVVRQTGGLNDTVFDVDYSETGLARANGFVFRDPDETGLDSALDRALRLWYENPEAFYRLIHNGMTADWSWRGPTKDYENIYYYIKA